MVSFTRMAGCLAVLALAGSADRCTAGENTATTGGPKERASVDIGMPNSLFQGMPTFLKPLGVQPFEAMMKRQTGISGKVQFPADAAVLANDLDAGRVQIGVMQGHELAWARKKHPTLTPIAVAVPMQPVQSFCLVKWDCTAKNIGELKAGKISLPPVHRDYSELFLAKLKAESMKGGDFAGRVTANDAADAIDAVGDGKVECTVVDAASVKYYQTVYPGRFENVKILCQSEVFPNACIVVKQGELNSVDIDKFVGALLKAKNDPVGAPMLSTWKVRTFIMVPADYEAQLKAIGLAYPGPSVDK